MNKFARNLLSLCKSEEQSSGKIESLDYSQEIEIFKLFFTEEVHKVEKSIRKKKIILCQFSEKNGKTFFCKFLKKTS
jgi:sulfur relay (sulfurtransferase) DsrF/TusC family protein